MPGKVLLAIAGKPVLWHIIHRLRKCTTIDTIAIATSSSPVDDPIVEFSRGEQIECIRGSEDNVLERYVLAAERLKAGIIIRVTGDAPLIDPGTVDLMVRTLDETGADFCTGDPGMPSIHEGFDAFTITALRRLSREASADPVAREHVSAYIKKNPEQFTITTFPIDPDHQFHGARISVDTPADFIFLERIYARLHVQAGEADLRDVVRLLRSDPTLLAINAHVHQKSAEEKSVRVLMRCDGDEALGLGHVYRSLALADELRTAHGCGVSFAMASGTVGFNVVKGAFYPVDTKPEHVGEDAWLDGIIQRLHPHALVLDVRSDLSREAIEQWRSSGLLCATIDDPSERRLSTDLAFYPPVPQVKRLDWTGFTGTLHAGWDWVLLRREFAHDPRREPQSEPSRKARPTLLVTMGGSDPAGITLKAVEALDTLDEVFDAIVLLGAAFRLDSELDDIVSRARRRFDIRRNIADVPGLMAEADLAIASFGVTAYELAAMGVPAIHLCLTPDHCESASAFVDAGMAVCLGLQEDVSVERLAAEIQTLLMDPSGRATMERTCRKLIDCRGVIRIARELTGRLRSA
jgi:spore coat polysaccharide biosynthesis protein SpsF